jgi:hypothetical protein
MSFDKSGADLGFFARSNFRWSIDVLFYQTIQLRKWHTFRN